VSATPTELRQILLDDYIALLGEGVVEELKALAARIAGRRFLMVNSTAVGGGVAEILNSLVPLIRQLGLGMRWEVLSAGEDFFEITKAFHNSLQGAPFTLPRESYQKFLDVNAANAARLSLDADCVVIHDPQPAALIQARPRPDVPWVWRCHIDLSRPDPDVWSFLEPYVNAYNAAIFSSPEFARQLPIPQYLFFPSIDPLAAKNMELEPSYIARVLEQYGIDPKRRILTQISRFDRWKDPLGVIRAYRNVKKYLDCQLVLAGGGATDDPEAEAVLAEVAQEAAGDPDIHVLLLPPSAPLEINALQRASTILIQKSLREGFGLTVTEALWKKKPVVASAVGGIPEQIIHKHTGMLAYSVEGTAYQIRYLLSHPEIARRLGENGYEHVRENFLITSNLKRYLTLFIHLLGS
jgi:trehalose synthase